MADLRKRERIFFVHLPLLTAGLLIATFFAGTAADWSERKAFAVGMLVCVVYTTFVVCPILILTAPKKEKFDEQ